MEFFGGEFSEILCFGILAYLIVFCLIVWCFLGNWSVYVCVAFVFPGETTRRLGLYKTDFFTALVFCR